MEILEFFTIYQNTSDYPGKFVVRRHTVQNGSSSPIPDPLLTGNPVDDVETARSFIPSNCTNLGKSPMDDPTIIETWMT